MAAPSIASFNSGTANGATTIGITLTNTPPGGGVIAVLLGAYFDLRTSSGNIGVTASGGTGVTITERTNPPEVTGFALGIWTIEYTTPPTSLTVGRSSPADCFVYGHAVAVNVTGQDASYFDVASTTQSTGTSTSPSASGMPDLTDSSDLVLGIMCRDGSSIVGGPATNWTELFEVDEDNDPAYASVIYRTPGATGSYDPAWTLASSVGWYAAGIAIKGTAGGSAQDLDGDAAAAATAAGTLSHGVPLAAGATGQTTAAAGLTHGVPLQGDAAATADAVADVSVSGASVIAFRSLSSVPQSGVSSVLFRQPDTLENTDLALWCVVNKYPTNGPNTPTGYTLTAQAVMGDGGAAGADQGDVYATVFHRVCDGTEDAATESISIPSGNAAYSRSIAFSRSGGTGWNIATAAGSQGTASANWNITTGNLDLAAGDTVLVFVAKNSDLDVVGHSAHSLSATGVTFGTFNSRAGPTGTTSGDDVAYQLGEVQVTAGSGSGPVTFTMSATGSGGNSSGGVMLVRLRAATAVDLAGAAVVTGTATGGLSHGVPLQGSAAGVAAASAGLTHGVPLAGTSAGQATAAAGLTHGVPLQGAAAGQATAAAQIVVQVSEAEMFGRRPRPGRGPYSVGRYFRPRVEAYTPISYADLTGSASGLSTAAGALSVGVTLAGASVSVATAAGAITHGVPLAGSGIATAAANGSLNIAVALQGSAVAQASAGGTLSLQIGLAGGALAQAAATAAMAHGVPLAGAALAAATATGQLDDGGLHGSAAGQASAAGQLSLSVPLSAAAVAQAQATGTLSIVTTLSAAALGQAAAGGALDVAVHLLGAAQGQAIASGSLDADGVVVLAGQAQAEAAAAAGLSIGVALDGDAAGQATSAAALSVLAGLGGAASATATATARLTAPVLMSGRPSNRRPSGGRRPAQLQRGYRQ